MPSLTCEQDEAFTAYFCVTLFDSIGYELHAQDLQEATGPMGFGIYCTLDLEKAQRSGKEILICEFKPTNSVPWSSGASDMLVVSAGGESSSADGRWRQRGFSGCIYNGSELVLRCECISALYRREWLQPQPDWRALVRLMATALK
eukprot:TRINITY_DN57825_c0_g1_i1.p1 TRINITY_DN57825_c0_g1~~TRINITY_DN57825_c0_g1_i1.p1  ORF type:complete len:146 (+),score=29.62 TRINITY_DN57825_c0_g1_i1:89-526(+)